MRWKSDLEPYYQKKVFAENHSASRRKGGEKAMPMKKTDHPQMQARYGLIDWAHACKILLLDFWCSAMESILI